jgi:putative RNA 2'-phosphotransferase
VSGEWAELSRAVSHALRHEPWLYELELDDEGWAPVDALVTALSQEPRWRALSRAQLETMIETGVEAAS